MGNGRAVLHQISAFATHEKLVLTQKTVAQGSSEPTPSFKNRLPNTRSEGCQCLNRAIFRQDESGR